MTDTAGRSSDGAGMPEFVDGEHFDQVFEQEMTQWVEKAAQLGDRPSRRRDPATGEPRPTSFSKKPDQANELVGLAISGGGIRSATFGLGVMQAMSDAGVLNRIDYLSTVSGGGYIGSAFSALLHQRAEDPNWREVMKGGRPLDRDRAPLRSNPAALVRRAGPFLGYEDATVRHMREQGNFLVPNLGLFDTQTWRAIFRLVSFMFLTALFLGIPPFLLATSLLALIPHPWDCIYDHDPSFPAVPPAKVVASDWGCWGWDRVRPLASQWSIVFRPLDPEKGEEAADLVGEWDHDFRAEPDPTDETMAEIAQETRPLEGLAPAYLKDTLVIPWPGITQPVKWTLEVQAPPATDEAPWYLRLRWVRWVQGLADSLATRWVVVVPSAILALSVFVAAGLSLADLPRSTALLTASKVLLWTSFACVAMLAFVFGVDGYYWVFANWIHGNDASRFAWLWGSLGTVGAGFATIGLRIVLGPASGDPGQDDASRLWALVMKIALAVAGYLLLFGFVLYLYSFMEQISYAWDRGIAVVSALWIGGALVLNRPVLRIINEWSLHKFYREGLTRAFMMKEQVARDLDTGQIVVEKVFGGEDVPLSRLQAQSRSAEGSHAQGEPDGAPWGPFHILMTTVNFSGSTDNRLLARKGDSFALTPLYSGSTITGYASTKEAYPAMTLGQAMAISGAAASPNMGTSTSTSLSIIFTALNVRLGYWLAHPRTEGHGRRLLSWPPSLWYFAQEMFGAAEATSPYIYLSDGGHFENSAIYELIRRRCRYIIAIDSAGEKSPSDVTFEGLGIMARLVRVDFGVDVDIRLGPVTPNPFGRTPANYIVGTIRYPKVERRDWTDEQQVERRDWTGEQEEADQYGMLIVIRSTLTDNPFAPDLEYFRRTNPTFPSTSTADQFFDEGKFEAYRTLGNHIARDVFQNAFRSAAATDEDGFLAIARLFSATYKIDLSDVTSRDGRDPRPVAPTAAGVPGAQPAG